MTNKSMLSVPRELLQRLCMRPRHESLAVNHQDIIDRGTAQAEMREILAAPAEDVRAVVDEPEIVAIVESALRRSFTLGQIYWQQADSDSTSQQNKSDQTMETQSNHIAMVLKSIQRLIK